MPPSQVPPHFVVKVVTGVDGRKCDWQHSMANPRKSLYICKNLADISYAGRVIALFVPNFVAMATGIGRGKCNWQHSMVHPRKPPMGAKILQKSFTQAELKPILSHLSSPWQRGLVGENAIGSTGWPIPENPPIGAKISQKSPTQAEL